MFVTADEARAFATLLVVSMCFLRRRTITRCSAPKGDECQRLKFKRMVPRQCSLSPGQRLRCCGAESGCTHAAAKHGDGCGDQGDGLRPGSAADVHARLLLSLSQFDASAVSMELFRGSVAVQQWFLGHVQVWIQSERSPCKEIWSSTQKLEVPRLRAGTGMEQCTEKFTFRGQSHDRQLVKDEVDGHRRVCRVFAH